jgi:Flp pilus assembly protein TadD
MRQPELTADARLRVAEAADQSGDRDLAVAMYSSASAQTPSDVALQLRCAEGLARNGKVDMAQGLLSDRLRDNSQQPDLLRALGVIDVVAGRPEQAIVQLDKALAVRPQDLRALVDKGVALDLSQQHAAAQMIYKQALALSPDDPVIRNDMALSLMLDGRVREAKELLASVKDAARSSERLRTNLGILYAANGDTEEARRLLGDRMSAEALSTLTRAIPNSASATHQGS